MSSTTVWLSSPATAEHTCGTLYRAGVVTRGCPACPPYLPQTGWLVGGITGSGKTVAARSLMTAEATQPPEATP